MQFAFDFWQRWGVALDDASFANAFVALGLATPSAGTRSVKDLHGFSAPFGQALWSFPDPATPVVGSPWEWAQAWAGVHASIKRPVRLYVMESPPREQILPWYRMLYEASPAPDAVALFEPAPGAQFHMEWPLRFGALSDDGWAFLEKMSAKELWPARKLGRMVRLGREQDNCDVLLHRGTPRALLQELLALPFTIKANVVVMRGGTEMEQAALHGLLASVLAETHASGFVLLPVQGQDDEWLLKVLNEFLAELSHALPIDVAFSLACPPREGRNELVAGFTPAITGFSLRQLTERYNKRAAALPRGTEIELKAKRVPADSVVMPDNMMFDSESGGGSTIADVADAVTAAAPPPAAAKQRTDRFLQQRSFVHAAQGFVAADKGFVAERPAKIEVRIGLPEEGLDQASTRFPVEELPPELERWTLTVVLSEPDHLREPLRRRIRLPRDGNSTWCEFLFRPRDLPHFEGRLTVLHRGRVIQTAMLRASVSSATHPAAPDGAPKLEDQITVRHRLADLDRRRQFDLALVANHDSRGRPLLTAVSSNAAWVKDLTRIPAIAAEINKTLTPVAKSVQDFVKGIDGKKGEAVLVQLAQHGGMLRAYLNEALDDPANNPASAKQEYVQIVSTRSDAVVPLEFVYDFEIPEDGAACCSNWRKAVKDGKCPADCERKPGKWVCPMGFWGMSKVIERHAVTPGLAKDGNILYLQSETSRSQETLYLGGASVLGSSARVPAKKIEELTKVLATHCGTAPKAAKDWEEWERLVKDLRPALLVALPHTDGTKTNVTVEIGDKPVKTITLRDTHVFPPPQDGRQAPLVLLIGCDVAGTADDYGNHVMIFRSRGAGIVVGTIATVFGEHAAAVAGKLVEHLLPEEQGASIRLGECMRAVRRNSLLDNLLMPLCLVAYGDADWVLSRRKADA